MLLYTQQALEKWGRKGPSLSCIRGVSTYKRHSYKSAACALGVTEPALSRAVLCLCFWYSLTAVCSDKDTQKILSGWQKKKPIQQIQQCPPWIPTFPRTCVFSGWVWSYCESAVHVSGLPACPHTPAPSTSIPTRWKGRTSCTHGTEWCEVSRCLACKERVTMQEWLVRVMTFWHLTLNMKLPVATYSHFLFELYHDTCQSFCMSWKDACVKALEKTKTIKQCWHRQAVAVSQQMWHRNLPAKSSFGRMGIICSTGMLWVATSCHRKYCSIVSQSKLASETHWVHLLLKLMHLRWPYSGLSFCKPDGGRMVLLTLWLQNKHSDVQGTYSVL